MWAALLSLVAITGSGPVPDAAWVVELAPTLAKCERRGTSALTTWACPEFNFAICHQDCNAAVEAIEKATSNRYRGRSVLERAQRRLPVTGNFAVIERTTWIVGRGAVAASLDVMHRDRDALVCGVSPMNPVGEHQCDALFSRLVEADLTGRPAEPVPPIKEPAVQSPKRTKSKANGGSALETKSEAVELTDDRRMAFAIQAYAAADYGRAGALTLQIIGSPKATARQRREALMMTGAIHRLEGRDNQARASFLQVLEDDPQAKLPRVYPIAVRRFFALVQQEMKSRTPSTSAPTTRALGIETPPGCQLRNNGKSRAITCNNVQLQWRLHQSAANASRMLQDELMAYRAYAGIEIKKRYVECMIRNRASRCIDMNVKGPYGDQRSLLGYADVNGRILSVSCRWAGASPREPFECRGLITKR